MDSSRVSARRDYLVAVRGLLGLLPHVRTEDWARTGLGSWSVRDLVGHTSRALLTVTSYLEPAQRTENPDLPDAVAYFRAAAAALADPAAVAERGRQAGAALGASPVAAVQDLADRVLRLVESSSDDALVATPAGTMTLAGYLPTRTFELVVHGLDLAIALGVDPPALPVGPVAGCLQLAAALAAERADAAAVLLALTGRGGLPTGFSVV